MNLNTVFLVVDDMEGMRRLIANTLNRMGMRHVLLAANGQEAWRLLQNQRVDVVISDWSMPVMGGLELLQKIRASAEHSKLPVLMVTAETDRHQVELAANAGVSGYLVKPFSLAALEGRLNKILSPARAPEAAPAPLPVVRRTAAGPLPVPATPTAPERQATLLAVDDLSDNLDVLVALLSPRYQVKVADSGARALKILASGKPIDLILLDVMMPEMDGFETCRRIKQDPKTSDIPVIFLSALSESIDVTKGFAAGAVDFVSKPADPPILHARIETHLALRRSMQDLKRSRIELIEKNAVLEENSRLRDEVERIAQHDLKNPVSGILGFAEALLDDERLSEEHKDIVRTMEQSAYSVLNLVNLSLDLYKIERGSYVLEPRRIDLAPILNRILLESQSELAARGLTVNRLRDGVPVDRFERLPALGDELLCYSMVSNLWRNAMEAAPAQTALDLDLRADAQQVSLRLRNSGVVPKSLRESFFDKFSTAGKSNGTGLGTYSAKLMAVTQHGDITMQTSDDEQATTLTVTLPGASDRDAVSAAPPG